MWTCTIWSSSYRAHIEPLLASLYFYLSFFLPTDNMVIHMRVYMRKRHIHYTRTQLVARHLLLCASSDDEKNLFVRFLLINIALDDLVVLFFCSYARKFFIWFSFCVVHIVCDAIFCILFFWMTRIDETISKNGYNAKNVAIILGLRL